MASRWPRLVLAVLVGLGLSQACKSKVDPNSGHFSCTTDTDCGDGYTCISQFAGGALCYPAGACDAVEVCDGIDQNCDGRIDEAFPQAGAACNTGQLGVCSVGVTVCADAGLACKKTRDAGVEICNKLDDNCNGVVDDGFDFANDFRNCGACNRSCSGGAGTVCRNGQCVEVSCSDGVDNNDDGGTDCADRACLGQNCSADPLYNCGGRDADAGTADGGDPDGGDADGGVDAGSDAGLVIFCVPKESACDNGADDDLDGLFDCADPDCDGKTCAVGTTCSAGVCPPAG